jgi:hypothetical protein
MSGQLVELSTFTWIEFCIPYDARPTDRLFPVLIDDDSLEEAGIYKNDIALVNLACKPCQGQFAAIETLQEYLLGYVFKLPNGSILLESACTCLGCTPRYIPQSSILNLAPVSWICRSQGNASYTFGYSRVRTPQRRRERLELL